MKIKKITLYSEVVKNTALNETLRVYDLTVEDTHNYVVSGVVVSNSKRISLLDTNALLSAGATETLRDAAVVRGQSNPDYWLQFMSGFTPKPPRVPYVYEKFVNSLKGAGINVLRKGSKLQVMAMTNQDIDNLAEDRVIESGETVRFDNNMEPVKGGLFDPKLTGGHNSSLWAKIKLDEPMLNPVMEEPTRRLLGLTQKQLEGIISGDQMLGSFGTGSKAIKKALENLNVDKELEIARQQIKSGKKTYKDAAQRRIGYLKSAQQNGVNPADWVLDSVPVLPPMFRPVSVMGSSGLPLVSDTNYLYKEIIESNKNLKAMKKELGDDGVNHERGTLYKNFKALTGLTDPIHPKLQEKNVKGILKGIFGSSPKLGCFDDDTEILTQIGWKKFSDLLESDNVLTLNPKDGFCEWQVPAQIFHYDYKGELFWLGTKRGIDCVVTPNHRNWIRYREGNFDASNMEEGWRFELAYKSAIHYHNSFIHHI